MEISARNSLKGKVKRVLPGAVNTEVIKSAERLNMTVGKEVYAAIKASDVMIATD